MPEQTETDHAGHVRPFVYEDRGTKALHFSICEIQSRMQTRNPDALDLEYTRRMMGFLLFNGSPDTLAMIGLGGGSLAKFCYRHLPDTRIKVIEINPHVIALRQEFNVPADDQRFKVRRGDGADFARFPPYQVDVLMVDGFDSEGQPPALSSQRFYDDCCAALKPDGMLVVNMHADHKDYDSFVARIRRSFDDEVLVVASPNSSNAIVFACRGDLLQRIKPAVLRRPRHFDAAAWDDLLPSLAAVAHALKVSSQRSAG